MDLFLLSIFFPFCFHSSTSFNNLSRASESPHKISFSRFQIQNFTRDSILKSGFYFVADTNTGYKRRLEKTNDEYFLHPLPFITIENFKAIEIYDTGDGKRALLFRFDEKGKKNWEFATTKAWYQKKPLAFVVKNRLIYVPFVLNGPITSGTTNFERVDYSYQELMEIKKQLENEE